MTIERVYLITWIQRTTIHLQEMYHLFTRKFDALALDPKKLEGFAKDLAIKKVALDIRNDFETLTMTSGALSFSATEDGIFTLSTKTSDVVKAREELDTYYKKHLGPALAYLFGRGAPLPKQLHNVKEIYPILIVIKDATEKDAHDLFKRLREKPETSVASETAQIFFSPSFIVTRIIKEEEQNTGVFEEMLTNIVFVREFEKQLRQYLNLHRTMWDEISAIRESHSLRYKDFPLVRRKIMDFLKTLFFVKARLSQMHDINKARLTLLPPAVKEELQALGLFRFENALADQEYMRDLWEMTIEYVEGTLEILESLFQENTQRELGALKFITFIGALTGFFGMNIAFPWEERWIATFPSSLVVVLFIALASVAFYYLLRSFIYNRYFTIRDKK